MSNHQAQALLRAREHTRRALRATLWALALTGLFVASPVAAQGVSADELALEQLSALALGLSGTPSAADRRVESAAGEMAKFGAAVDARLVVLSRTDEPAVRRAAVRALGQRLVAGADRHDMLPAVITRLSDEDRHVAREAAGALTTRNDAWSSEALVRWLASTDPGTREAIVGALDSHDEGRINGLVRMHIRHPPQPIGSGPWIAALGRYPDRTALADLIRSLDDKALGSYAVAGLANYGPGAIRAIEKWLRKNVSAAPSHLKDLALALIAFGESGVASGLKLLGSLPEVDGAKKAAIHAILEADGEAAVKRVESLALHKDTGVRKVALEIMLVMPTADPSASLASNVKHRDRLVRMLAYRTVEGRARNANMQRVLVDRHRDLSRKRKAESLEERRAALKAIGTIGVESAAPFLIQSAGRDDEMRAALEGLGNLGAPAIDWLLFVIKTGDPVRTPLAVEALARVGPAAVGPMVKLLVHPSRDVRNTARRGLADMRAASAVPGVITLIQDPESPGREALVALLGRIGVPEAMAAVREFADTSTDFGIREAACRVLGQSGTEDDLEILRRLAVDDPNNQVRHVAVQGLFWTGDTKAVPLLARMLAYEKDFIRKTAAMALGYLAGPEHVAGIVPAMSTPRSEILTAVRDALRRLSFRDDLVTPDDFLEWSEDWVAGHTPRQPLEMTKVTLTTGHVIAYGMLGDGAPLVVIPGGPDLDHRYLRAALDGLAEKRLVIYLDLPGRGAARGVEGVDLGKELGVVADASAVAELLTRLNLSDVEVYAHGWGAMTAAMLAARHPDRVARLVLDSAPAPTAAGWAVRNGMSVVRVQECRVGDLRYFSDMGGRFQIDALDSYATTALLTGLTKRSEALVDVSAVVQTHPSLRLKILEEEGDFDYRAAFEGLRQPTLLVYGDAPPLDDEGLKWREAMVQSNDAVSLRRIEAASCLPGLENAEQWRDVVDAFLP